MSEWTNDQIEFLESEKRAAELRGVRAGLEAAAKECHIRRGSLMQASEGAIAVSLENCIRALDLRRLERTDAGQR